MVTTLRAFAWLRWRMFINSLEQTGSRDMLERFSLAIEKLGPILAAVLLIPSVLTLASLGGASGYALASGDTQSVLAQAPRYLLLVVPLLSIVGPLLLPAGDRTNPVRLLLLPISRGTLYVAQSATALGDVWVVLMLPLLVSVPLGLAAGGAPGAATISLMAGGVLVLVVVAISSTATSLLHMAVRDRRRGELLALLFLLLIPMAGMLPTIAQTTPRSGDVRNGASQSRGAGTPAWVAHSVRRAASLYPTELYTRATHTAAAGAYAPAARTVGALATVAVLLNVLGVYVFRKVLESPSATGGRRQRRTRGGLAPRLPWLSPGASAVALAQFRLALRTPRGRAIVLSPVALVFVFVVLGRRDLSALGFDRFGSDPGLAIACFASFLCLLSILPIALNQFAVDKAGLTRVLLSPLSDRDYLRGKATGNGLIVAPPVLFSVGVSFIALSGQRSIVSWLGIPLALLSIYFLVAPAAATFSAMFPRVVDMNSIGRGSNAHGLSGLLGIVAFLVAGIPSVAIATGVTHWFNRPGITLAALFAWCVLSFFLGRVLFIPARRIFSARRENLAML